MPRASGVDVTKKVKELHPQTQVIVITGHEPNEEYKRLSERLGEAKPDGIVQKPIMLESIKHIVDQIRFVIEKRKIEPNYQPEPFSYQTPPQS